MKKLNKRLAFMMAGMMAMNVAPVNVLNFNNAFVSTVKADNGLSLGTAAGDVRLAEAGETATHRIAVVADEVLLGDFYEVTQIGGIATHREALVADEVVAGDFYEVTQIGGTATHTMDGGIEVPFVADVMMVGTERFTAADATFDASGAPGSTHVQLASDSSYVEFIPTYMALSDGTDAPAATHRAATAADEVVLGDFYEVAQIGGTATHREALTADEVTVGLFYAVTQIGVGSGATHVVITAATTQQDLQDEADRIEGLVIAQFTNDTTADEIAVMTYIDSIIGPDFTAVLGTLALDPILEEINGDVIFRSVSEPSLIDVNAVFNIDVSALVFDQAELATRATNLTTALTMTNATAFNTDVLVLGEINRLLALDTDIEVVGGPLLLTDLNDNTTTETITATFDINFVAGVTTSGTVNDETVNVSINYSTAPSVVAPGRVSEFRFVGNRPNVRSGEFNPNQGGLEIFVTNKGTLVPALGATGVFVVEVALDNATFPTNSQFSASNDDQGLREQRAQWTMVGNNTFLRTAGIIRDTNGDITGSDVVLRTAGNTARIEVMASFIDQTSNTTNTGFANDSIISGLALPFRATGDDAVVARMLGVSHDLASHTGTVVLTNNVDGTTINSVTDTVVGIESVSFNLSVRESQRGFFSTAGGSSSNPRIANNVNFELRAPSGFRWVRPSNSQINDSITTSANVSAIVFNNESTDTVLEVNVTTITNNNFDTVIRILGLELEAINVSNPPQGEVRFDIRNVTRSSATLNGTTTPARGEWVSDQTLVAGEISDFDVTLTRVGRYEANPIEVLSGMMETEVARIRVEENIAGAINERLAFTLQLPEGVNVYSARFANQDNLTGIDMNTTAYNTSSRTARDNANIIVDRNRLTIRLDDNRNDTNETVAFELDLVLSIAPTFEGDVELSLGGRAAANASENSVIVAEAVAPISVSAQTTPIRVGYQFMDVANFTITENKAGALERGELVWVSITDGIFTELAIAGGVRAEVTEGDLAITDLRTVNETNFAQGGVSPQLSFEIDADSREASTIEFTNVQVRQLFVAPQSNRGYDLLVWGPAVSNNGSNAQLLDAAGFIPNTGSNVTSVLTTAQWDRLFTNGHIDGAGVVTVAGATEISNAVVGDIIANPRTLNNDLGISTEYLTVEVPGSTSNTGIVNSVLTFDVDGVVTVNGEVSQQNVEAFGRPTIIDGALYLPARLAFSLFFEGANPDSDIFVWNPQTSTFRIDQEGQDIMLQVDNTIMTVRGIERTIRAGEGDSAIIVAPFVDPSNSRMMIPARAFGEALGFTVSFTDGVATFTPVNANN